MKKVFSHGLFIVGILVLSLSTFSQTLAADKKSKTPPPVVVPQTALIEPSPDTIIAGDLIVTGTHIVFNQDHVDIFLSIKNNSKYDEKLIGGGTDSASSTLVQVTKDRDGKEEEAPVSAVLPAEKTSEFSKDGTWLRVTDVDQPGDSDIFEVSLYSRRSPNINLKIPFNPSMVVKPSHTDATPTPSNATAPQSLKDKIMNWFKSK
jgi:copper(I)-binding protein